MRRVAIALLAALLLTLSGCTQSIYKSYRDIESLEIVQALGLDLDPGGGVTVSVATGSDASGREPVRLACSGTSFDGAMRGLELLAGRGTLFFSGTGAIVLGASAAGEAERWLDSITRSTDLRLDTEFFVLKSGTAGELLTGDGSPEDVFADLNALSERMRSDGPAPVPTCADVARALIASNAALAAAINVTEGADGSLTPTPAGFAILTPDGLAGWLDEDAALGAGLFIGGPGSTVVELQGGVTAGLAGAKVSMEPVWDEDGAVAAINVSVEVSGSVIEAPAGSKLGSEDSWASLERELSELVCSWTVEALDASVSLGADFLGLGRYIESTQPVRFSNMPVLWEEALSTLEIRVSCSARILNMREYADSPYTGVSS